MAAVLATQAPSSNSLPSIDSLQPFPAYQDLVEATKQFVQKELSQNDAVRCREKEIQRESQHHSIVLF